MRRIAVVVLAGALGACGVTRQQAPVRATCDIVVGTSTAYGRTLASRQAEQDARQQMPDARGDLVSSGVRRVRVVQKRTTCRPYALFSGATSLTTCTAEARVCGR